MRPPVKQQSVVLKSDRIGSKILEKECVWNAVVAKGQNIILGSKDFGELCRISTCKFQTSHSQIGVARAEIWIFFIFISSKNYKHDFLKSAFFKIRTLFSGLIHCLLQTSHSQIGVGRAKIWMFFCLYIPQKL